MLIKITFVEDVPDPYRAYKHGGIYKLNQHLVIDSSLDLTGW